MKPTKQQREEMLSNLKEVKQHFAEVLTSNANAIVQSGPGMGKLAMIKEVSEQKNMKPLVFELGGDMSYGTGMHPTVPLSAEDIVKLLKNNEAKVIVLDMLNNSNSIDRFVEAAKQLELPVVVSITTTRRELSLESFSSYEELTTAFETTKKSAALEKMASMKNSTVENTSKKLTQ